MKYDRSACVILRPSGIYLHPWSYTTVGLGIMDGPIVMLPLSASDEELGFAVLQSLDGVRTRLEHPKTFSVKDMQPLVDAARVKTYSAFVKHARSATIVEKEGALVYTPSENRGPRRSWPFLTDLEFSSPDLTPAAVGINTRKVLELAR